MTNYSELIKTPRAFFKSVGKEPLDETLKKVAIPLFVFIVTSAILNNILFQWVYTLFNFPPPTLNSSILVSVISVPLSLLIMSSLLQLSLKILKIRSAFSQTVKVILYPTVFILALMILIELATLITPVQIARLIIYLIAATGIGIWSVILTVIGLSELNKISIGKAVGAYSLSIGLLIAAYIAVMIVAFICWTIIYFITQV